ncbi:hypothetical protein T459_31082 [Capsicum annuum]|uniref:AT-hook motif nuclear-localized protein n=1 Tax=Capsicum annuum TaxID=4072 RepID=A0A2G2YA82_CAPAN|nr:hypothetical protein T459_31082 [Capsicum annuum]
MLSRISWGSNGSINNKLSSVLTLGQFSISNCGLISSPAFLSLHSILQQPCILLLEGLFDILSLSGSFLPSEIGGPQGGVSVLLAGRDGRVLGGAVAGVLISASPVQVIVSTITPPATPLNPNLGSATRGNSPPSRGTYSGLSSLLPSHPKSKRSIRHEV